MTPRGTPKRAQRTPTETATRLASSAGCFDTIFPTGLAKAAVDRLLHHAQVIVTEGRRLTEALDGRGVEPPPRAGGSDQS